MQSARRPKLFHLDVPGRRRRARRAPLYVLGAAGLGIGLYALAGFLGGPWLVERWLDRYRAGDPDRTATLDGVRFNPFTLVAGADGLELRDGDTGLSADRLIIDFAAASLLERRPVIRSIAVERPQLRLASVLQLPALAGAARDLGLDRTRIDRLGVITGSLMIGADRQTELTGIDLRLANFDAVGGADARVAVSAGTPTGATLAIDGGLAANLERVDGQLHIGAVDPVAAAAWLGDVVDGVALAGSTELAAEFSLQLEPAGPRLELTNARIDFPAVTLAPAAGLTITMDAGRADGQIVLVPGTAGLDLSGSAGIERASFAFADARVAPPRSFRIGDAAVLTTFGTDTDALSLTLAGQVAGAGPASLTVRMPPGSAGGTRVAVNANALPAAMLSAYAVDALGRGLAAGSTDLTLAYTRDGRRVDGTLGIVARDLAFTTPAFAQAPAGDGAPVELAAALLEAADGVFALEIPFAGSGGSVREIAAAALEARIAAVSETPFDALAPLIGDQAAGAVPFLPGDAALNDRAVAAIGQLAEALSARPRLAMRVHGGYEPNLDRNALARQQIELHVQLATAGPGNQARPAPVDFASPRARDVLDEFAGERLPTDQVDSLRERYTCEGPLAEICARTYYEAIFDALVANEEIAPTALNRLGRFRALSVIDALRQQGIAEDRIELVTGSEVVETPFGIGLTVELTAAD